MSAKGENSRCLYKNGESKTIIIDSADENASREDGWMDTPNSKPVTVDVPEQPTTEETAEPIIDITVDESQEESEETNDTESLDSEEIVETDEAE